MKEEKKIAEAILKCSALYHRGVPIDLTVLADCRDYFIYKALDNLKAPRDEAKEFVRRMEEFERECERYGDRFHAGFFFTLAQLVSVAREIPMLPGERISREEFERSWRRTREKLGL